MENVVEHIRGDMKEAMKAHEALKLETLRGVLSAFTNELVAKGRKPQDSLTDEEAFAVLKRLGKQRKEAAEQFHKGGRTELAEKEEKELEIIGAYLPASLSREEIEKIAHEERGSLSITDATGKGRLMGAIMKRAGGNADSETVKAVVDSLF